MNEPGIEKRYQRSIDEAIEQIRKVRNNLIVSILVNPENYLPRFGAEILSAVRMEFLKRDLLELQKSSLDLVQYAGLIKALRDNPDTECLPDNPLILEEIQQVVSRYYQ